MALALAPPWETRATPFKPRSGAPPYSAGSVRLSKFLEGPFEQVFPENGEGVFPDFVFNKLQHRRGQPFAELQQQIPTNPSQTNTSAPPGDVAPSTMADVIQAAGFEQGVGFLGEQVAFALLLADGQEPHAGTDVQGSPGRNRPP
jgi:hypothetical protein